MTPSPLEVGHDALVTPSYGAGSTASGYRGRPRAGMKRPKKQVSPAKADPGFWIPSAPGQERKELDDRGRPWQVKLSKGLPRPSEESRSA